MVAIYLLRESYRFAQATRMPCALYLYSNVYITVAYSLVLLLYCTRHENLSSK